MIGSTAAAGTRATALRQRVDAVDIVRGIVMILMALDHTREYFGAIAISPTDLARASAPLFFTRWITHLCAPVFFLLTGTSAYLAARRRGTAGISRLLLTRGIWLIALELTVVRCAGYQFNADYRVTMLVVLWALGWSMIVLAALVHLPIAAITTIGAAIVAGHNLLDPISARAAGALAPLWTILHGPGVVVATPRLTIFAAYPLVPWIGVTAIGFGLGAVYDLPPSQRRRLLGTLGVALTAAFIVLRAVNAYGDPVRWTVQRSSLFTFLSFLNTTKYPPSLLFLLMTLGPAALFLWTFDRGADSDAGDARRRQERATTAGRQAKTAVRVYGQVPLFYFVAHLTLIHLLAVVACYARYGTAHWMFESPTLDRYPFTQPPGWGYSLGIVYVIWLLVVALLYPACRWYAVVKRRHDRWWLSYL